LTVETMVLPFPFCTWMVRPIVTDTRSLVWLAN
jgi:hypothetical protein